MFTYVINWAQIQKALHEYRNNVLSFPTKENNSFLFQPGDLVLFKTWKEGTHKDQLQPKWKGPYQVLFNLPTTVKLQGITRGIWLSRVKPVSYESLHMPEENKKTYTCEPLEDLNSCCVILSSPY